VRKLLIPTVFLMLGLIVLFGYYRMRAQYDQLLSVEAEQQIQSQNVTSFKMNGNEFAIDGKKMIVDYVNSDTANVEIKRENSFNVKNNHLYLTFIVTIKGNDPLLLTKDRYDKIDNDMTYSQVAKALGGAMTTGRLSDNFYGKLELVQGKRRVSLSFEDGKVTGKSAKDLD